MKGNGSGIGWTVLGLIATIGGMALSLLGGVVSDKKQEMMIEEKVNQALLRREKGE